MITKGWNKFVKKLESSSNKKAALTLVQTKIKFKETYFHTGEIATMSPCKPAAVGALVDVHVLQVNVHTDNTSVNKKKKKTTRKQISRLTFEDAKNKKSCISIKKKTFSFATVFANDQNSNDRATDVYT